LAAASVLNALTTKRKSWLTIAIVAADGSVHLRYDGSDETRVRTALRPLADAAFANRSAAINANLSALVEWTRR
jgi:alkylhydroperoxidase/carboxymuconolactone decarboxylase family protein YurZ